MVARKPRMPVTVALANKTARIIRAVLMKGEDDRAPVAAAAQAEADQRSSVETRDRRRLWHHTRRDGTG
jgi:hypothetical protein